MEQMQNLRVYVVTWNVKGQDPQEDLSALFRWNEEDTPDLIIVGMQEINVQIHKQLIDTLYDDPWNRAYRDILRARGYFRIHKERLQGILIMMFSLEKHIQFFRNTQSTYTRLGLNGLWGNKGVISTRTDLYGCSLCFVTCHLAPHDERLEDRIRQYNIAIKDHLYTDCTMTSNILYHDYVIWCGDLNFRIEEDAFTAEEIAQTVSNQRSQDLLNRDQLNVARRDETAFSEFQECNITFPPTYKYKEGTNEYTLSRRPAWTDRILWRVNSDVYESLGVTLSMEASDYTHFGHIMQSDHKPVHCKFDLKVFPADPSGLVTFLSKGPWYRNKEATCVYKVAAGYFPSSYDWIGLYKENVSCVQDYIYYQWASTDRNHDGTYCVEFPETAFSTVGVFFCLFFSNNGKDILGKSSNIEVIAAASSSSGSESSGEEPELLNLEPEEVQRKPEGPTGAGDAAGSSEQKVIRRKLQELSTADGSSH